MAWPKIVPVVFLLLVTFPGHYEPIRTGLDPSWRFALNDLANSPYVFGRDVNFTYGPLGYLLSPLDLGSNLLQAIVVQLVVHALFAACVIRSARAVSAPQVALFALGYAAATGLGLTYEYHLLLVIGLLMLASLAARAAAAVPAALAALLAVFGLAAKFTLGVGALAILFTAELVRLSTPEQRDPRATAATMMALIGGTGVLIVGWFGSLANFLLWLKTSLAISAGYTAAMGLGTRTAVLVLGYGVLAIFVGTSAWLVRVRSRAASAALIFSGPVLLAFKHGFVRAHLTSFFPFIVAVLALLLLVLPSRRGMRMLTLAAALAAAATVPAYAVADTLSASARLRMAAGERGVTHVGALLRLGRTRSELAQRSRRNLEADRLPAPWVAAIRAGASPMGCFPWEINYAPANDLAWVPNPVLQGYSAYTVQLDRRSAGHYVGERAPRFVVLEFAEIDLRHPMLGAPATVRELLRNYAMVDGEPEPGRLLLRRGAPRFAAELEPVARVAARAGQWIEVPRSDGLLFAELDMRLTVRGRVNELLFRIPPVALEAEYASGRRATHRMVPATAANGLLLSHLPVTVDDLAGLYRGTVRDRVLRFRIGGSGALLYRREIDVTWKRAGIVLHHEPGA